MASKTYSERVIVLRKTRLREADLILTMLGEDGRQLRAVAKGALKPTSSFASRLELYAESRVLLIEGRTLDIVKEARLEDAHAPLRFDYMRSVFAAPIAELLCVATQGELPVARLFAMTQAAFTTLEAANDRSAPLVMAAFLLKAESILGYQPSLARCVECGADCELEGHPTWFSPDAGGTLCADCAASRNAGVVSGVVIAWAHTLIHSTFKDIAGFELPRDAVQSLARFVQSWTEAHVGDLRSLPYALGEL